MAIHADSEIDGTGNFLCAAAAPITMATWSLLEIKADTIDLLCVITGAASTNNVHIRPACTGTTCGMELGTTSTTHDFHLTSAELNNIQTAAAKVTIGDVAATNTVGVIFVNAVTFAQSAALGFLLRAGADIGSITFNGVQSAWTATAINLFEISADAHVTIDVPLIGSQPMKVVADEDCDNTGTTTINVSGTIDATGGGGDYALEINSPAMQIDGAIKSGANSVLTIKSQCDLANDDIAMGSLPGGVTVSAVSISFYRMVFVFLFGERKLEIERDRTHAPNNASFVNYYLHYVLDSENEDLFLRRMERSGTERNGTANGTFFPFSSFFCAQG